MVDIEQEIKNIEKLNPGEIEFLQATREVLKSVEILLNQDEKYQKNCIIKRITEPDRQIKFRVCWKDDSGNINVNRGYRVQFNNTLGPYKGGLRFHPSVNMSIIKFLAFEQIFKNALTGLRIGGGKGGSDFDPKDKSDNEIMNFCQSFMNELYRHIGPERDIPAGDIGVGEREIGYLFGQYKKIRNLYEPGVLTGKDISYGGSLARKQATGYGLVYFTENILKHNNLDIKSKKICISGAGNVAIYACEKAQQLGAHVITMSDSTGWIYDPDGINLDIIKNIKEKNKLRIKEYQKHRPNSKYFDGKFMWDMPCDIALPCATQNELTQDCVNNIIKNKVILLAEGANMPVDPKYINLLINNNILFGPGKAANAGGVSVSALEMSQNSMGLKWTFGEVDTRLKNIMSNIFTDISNTCKLYNLKNNYLSGANILSFKKVADSMIKQGVI